MKTKRKAFNFLRSYFDVLNKLKNDDDKLEFLLAIINKQFLGVDPNNFKNDFVDLAWESQRHQIESSVKGYQDKTGNILSGEMPEKIGGDNGGHEGGSPQEKEKEKEKEKQKAEIQKIVSFYNSHSPKKTTPETKSVIDSCQKALKKYDVDQLISAINGRLFFLRKTDMVKHFTIQSIFRPSNIDGAVAAGEMDQPLIKAKGKTDGVKIAYDREMMKKPQFRNQSVVEAYEKRTDNE